MHVYLSYNVPGFCLAFWRLSEWNKIILIQLTRTRWANNNPLPQIQIPTNTSSLSTYIHALSTYLRKTANFKIALFHLNTRRTGNSISYRIFLLNQLQLEVDTLNQWLDLDIFQSTHRHSNHLNVTAETNFLSHICLNWSSNGEDSTFLSHEPLLQNAFSQCTLQQLKKQGILAQKNSFKGVLQGRVLLKPPFADTWPKHISNFRGFPLADLRMWNWICNPRLVFEQEQLCTIFSSSNGIVWRMVEDVLANSLCALTHCKTNVVSLTGNWKRRSLSIWRSRW